MKFYSVNFFVETIKGMEPDTKTINIIYQVKDANEDKFGKLSCSPVLIVLTKDDKKEIWDMNMIETKFNDTIFVTLPKPLGDIQGFANVKIIAKAEFSAKFGTNYYPKKYEGMTANVVKIARESIVANKKRENEEMLDL